MLERLGDPSLVRGLLGSPGKFDWMPVLDVKEQGKR
jgi:hypothetical protein